MRSIGFCASILVLNNDVMRDTTLNQPQFVLCVENTDYPASLEVRKLYQIIPDLLAEQRNFLRVIDESGEDYVYPAAYFAAIDLPQTLQATLLQTV